MIVVDSREASKHKSIVTYLTDAGVKVEEANLEVGDFLVFANLPTVEGDDGDKEWLCSHNVGHGINVHTCDGCCSSGKPKVGYALERKTTSDLISSLHTERGWEQVRGLADAKEQGYTPRIIWESGYVWDNDKKRPISWQTYLKIKPNLEVNWYSLIEGVSKWGIPIMPTTGEDGTAKLLKYLDDKLGRGQVKHDYPLRSGFRKDMSIGDKRVYLFDAFGHATGKALLSAYGSPIGLTDRKWLTHWVDGKWTDQERLVKEVADVKLESGRRIGEKKAREVLEVLLFN